MNTYLLAIMRENPDLAERIKEGTKEVQKSKDNLLQNASKYSDLYAEEISEGTKKRQLLLEDGKTKGKTEEEVLKEYGNFIPSEATPIMNFLYFFMRDGEKTDWVEIQKKLNEDLGHKNTEVSEVMSEEELEKIVGQLIHEDEQYTNVAEPEEMDRFIYGNLSNVLFSKIKKLKTLAENSSNVNESSLAKRLAIKLCEKFELNYEKIPTYL